MKKSLKQNRGKYYEIVGNWKERWSDIEPHFPRNRRAFLFDIGCAEGLVTLAMAEKVKHVTAIDAVEESIIKALELQTSNICFKHQDIFKYQPDKDSYDIVTCLGVVHKQPQLASKLINRCFYIASQTVIFRTLGEYSNDIIRLARSNGFNTFVPKISNIGVLYICNKSP